MKEHGIKVTIVSNNNEKRVKIFSEPLNIPFIYKAKKPMGGEAFRKAVKNMGLKKEDVVVIGDQLMRQMCLEGTATGSIPFLSCLWLLPTAFLRVSTAKSNAEFSAL